MAAKAYNCSDTPLVLDDGSVLAGREHGDVDTDSARVLDAVHARTLVMTHDATHERVAARAATRADELAAADAAFTAGPAAGGGDAGDPAAGAVDDPTPTPTASSTTTTPKGA